MMRLHKIFLTLVCLTALSAHAQWKWLNPLECGFPVIQNQGWTEEIGDSYVRLPQRAEGKVRNPSGIYPAIPPVWRFIFSATPLN